MIAIKVIRGILSELKGVIPYLLKRKLERHYELRGHWRIKPDGTRTWMPPKIRGPQ